ncbi:TRAP transporter substrate-binding protein [Desulfotomaculum sp. 1211_IL3151]|uniref:TRAP transporter substrate-binding protein n=1 Tax=Desulfotomaculum sp. 1211_IL3151 TaxID=3084055 RepID=UPI002FDAFB2B
MKKITSLFLVLLVPLMFLLSGCGNSGKDQAGAPKEEKIIIKYTHGVGTDPSDPHQWVALKFKELAEQYTDNRVEVQIFPGGQLGSEQRGFQDVQNGVVQATSLAGNNAAVFTPSVGIYDLPYMFMNREEAYKVMDGIWDDLDQKMIEQSGTRALIWFEQGFRVLTNSKKPVTSLADLQGLKIRVPQNPMMIGAFSSWGCEPTPIAWDETFSALQQGLVDGQENPHTVNNSMKFYEAKQKYITDIHYKMWIGPVVVQEKWLQSLPADIRDALIKAGRDTAIAERDFIVELETKALENLTNNGMEELGAPKDEAEWQKRAMATWPQFYDKVGGTELVEKAMNILGKEMPK